MKSNNYPPAETAKFKAERRTATKKFKKEMKVRGSILQLEYPETATQSQRGFTPAGSAKINYPAMVKLDAKTERPGIPVSARKPTNGSKRIFQTISLKKTIKVPARRWPERLGMPTVEMGAAFSFEKNIVKVIHHTRPIKTQPPLF